MPRTIGGVVYRHVARALVVNFDGNPVENLTGGVVYAVEGGSPLLLAEYPSGVPLATVPTGNFGITPDLYVAFPTTGPQEGFIDWPGDNIPAQAISATAAEIGDFLSATVAASSAAAAASAAAALAEVQALTGGAGIANRLTSLEQFVADAPTAYVQTVAGRPLRHTYLDGTAGDPDEGELQPNDVVEVFQ